jgi:hypothetical protein
MIRHSTDPAPSQHTQVPNISRTEYSLVDINDEGYVSVCGAVLLCGHEKGRDGTMSELIVPFHSIPQHFTICCTQVHVCVCVCALWDVFSFFTHTRTHTHTHVNMPDIIT